MLLLSGVFQRFLLSQLSNSKLKYCIKETGYTTGFFYAIIFLNCAYFHPDEIESYGSIADRVGNIFIQLSNE